jgi:hypothetical protein
VTREIKIMVSTEKFNKFYPSENTAEVIKLWDLKYMGHEQRRGK